LSSFIDADDEGRFAIPVWERAYLSFTLWLADPDGKGLTSLALDDASLAEVATHGKDLGDVALRPARTVTFRVRDPLGAPIAGVFATAQRGEELQSKKTDADGRSELRGLPSEPIELTFWATHRDSLKVMAKGPTDEHLEVTLERCASLEVTVRPTSGSLPTSLQFVLAASQQAFTGADEFGPEDTRYEIEPIGNISIESQIDSSTTPPSVGGKVTYGIPSDGTLSISCLRPAVPLTISVVDASGKIVWGEEIVTLARGEARTIEAPVPGETGK
jgi:hypothetical protein